MMTRYRYVQFVFVLVLLTGSCSQAQAANKPPNFVIVFADDLGYGDLSCFGHPTIRTPHLDKMAAEGIRFTQFYSAASVCTPSRAGLLTGRLPIRSGMCSDKRRVLFPNSGGGIPEKEVLISEALKSAGYATGCFGKWHLGHLKPFLPTSHGFDTYYGIPYSNDMDQQNPFKGKERRNVFWEPEVKYFNVPLMSDTEIIERPADQQTITRRYTEQAVKFIRAHNAQPFFVYLPHSLPHVPLFRGTEFAGKSARGLYGDVIEEIDWSVGQILQTLKEQKLAENTLVWFCSDNGPWLIFGDHGGSAGLLKDGKGGTWEGGMREPTIAWWPGSIPAGQVSLELGTTMDIYTTCLTLAGVEVPQDRVVDGLDLTPVLKGTGKSPREEVFYYRGTKLMAVRKGSYKAHFITRGAYGEGARMVETHDPPLLYNLDVDASERHNINDKHPEIIKEIQELVAEHQQKLIAPPSQLEIPLKQ